MAKKVRISLATKFRVLFGTSVLGIIVAALIVPWYLMERLADEGVQRSADEVSRLYLNEWVHTHYANPDTPSRIADYYTSGDESGRRQRPEFIRIKTGRRDPAIHGTRKDAVKLFTRSDLDVKVFPLEKDDQGQSVHPCYRAVRIQETCLSCHRTLAKPTNQFEPGQLVGLIEVMMPQSSSLSSSGDLAVVIRLTFGIAAFLAAFLALILFAVIIQALVLRPVRQLRQLADRVTEGDLAVRSTIQTGDELQRLGDSFNEMLDAIDEQHEKLTTANRALDLKLSELAEANVTLFQANKVKNEFLANVSHELRTPLNSIIGFADLLADSEDERVGRYGRNIVSSAKTLLNMINDLLDIAKIEAGKAHLHLDKVSVIDTCQNLAAIMQPLAEKKQLLLNVQLDESLPIVTTDAPKLQQILYNLLSNALKFTPAGGAVTLTAGQVTLQKDGEATQEVFVSVADTGPGIAEADQQRIFEKFYQADRTLTRESSGTGLGLSIARELTGLLGGRLTLQSTAGHGATFTLHLPVEAQTAAV